MKNQILVISLAVLSWLGGGAAFSQDADPFLGGGKEADLDLQPTDVIIWEPVDAIREPDGFITVGMRLRTEQNFSIYKKNAKFAGPAGFELKNVEAPPTKTIIDPIEGVEVEVYYVGDFILRFVGLEPFKGNSFPLSITFLGCTERICLFPYTQNFELPVNDASGLGVISSAAPTNEESGGLKDFSSGESISTANNSSESSASADDLQQEFAEKLSRGELSQLLLLLVLFLGGMATNLTPCVFPMIPITIRILGAHGHSSFKSSFLYALGIVASYTLLGVIVSLSGGMFGALLASSAFNLVFAILFTLLALSMLGFGNLAKLQEWGSRLGSGRSANYGVNLFLMGCGAGLVAAPCTGPILGALLAFNAKNPGTGAEWQFLVYSSGFALPYVFLGMGSHKVKKLKVSPHVQNGIKFMFAAVMFALSFYYLRVPLYNAIKQLQPYWGALALGALAFGLILAAIIVRAPKFALNKKWHLVPTVVLGISLFAGTQWLTAASVDGGGVPLTIHKTMDEGLAAAKAEGKPVLIDGWAEWCEACKKMDATTFQDATLRQTLSDSWILIKLDLTEMNEANQELAEKLGMQGLPTLVLLPSDGDLGKMKKVVGYASAPKLLQEMEAFRER